ncbi:MAG: patatin-like phospholipase family protein [Bellilinea sp.]
MEEISLALGGGGIKGIAHLGIIFRLQEAGFKIKAIAGTSAGGVVGAVIAAGAEKPEILEAVNGIDSNKFFSRQHNDGPSLLGLAGLVKLLSPFLHDKTFDDLEIPFAVTAVDFISKQEFILKRGPVINAVLATSSIPGVFPPVKIGNTELVDGGVLDPVPVAVARWLAPKLPVVAVCLSPVPEQWSELPEISVPVDPRIPGPIMHRLVNLRIGQAIRIYVDSMDITSRMITELRLQVEKPDVIIRPDVMKFGYLDRADPDVLINLGIEAVEKALPEIQVAMGWHHKFARQFLNPQPPGKLLED